MSARRLLLAALGLWIGRWAAGVLAAYAARHWAPRARRHKSLNE